MPVKSIALYIFVNDILKPNNHDEECMTKWEWNVWEETILEDYRKNKYTVYE